MASGESKSPYTLNNAIGEGGTATVFRAHDRNTGSQRAIKVVANATPLATVGLAKEARLLQTMDHPNVVAVYGMTRVGDAPALVMELLHGPPLDLWLLENTPSRNEALSIFLGVVRGVAYLHQKGMVHRDLKPGNVLLSREYGQWVPKIIDFGLATSERDLYGTTPGPAMIAGTPGYMAPEQTNPEGDIDARADLFALGCILYRLLCGKRAFRGGDTWDLLAASANRRYTPPDELVPDLPSHLVSLLHNLLQPDPELRVESCAELLTRLRTPKPVEKAPVETVSFGEVAVLLAPLALAAAAVLTVT